MKTYTFYDEGYYDQPPGCSCCEGTYMECYNSDDTDCDLGSAHDYESCYYQAIMTETGVDDRVMREVLHFDYVELAEDWDQHPIEVLQEDMTYWGD